MPKCKDFYVYEFQRSRNDDRPYRLFICQLGECKHNLISSLSKFYDHLRSHCKEKPYVCSYGCGKSFSQLGNCNKHIEQIHLNVKKFKCQYCQRKFTKKYNMLMHEQVERLKL